MSRSINKVALLGHVGQEPTIRTTQDGREVATFSLATGEVWKDKATGERKERTEWHRIVVFRETLVKLVKAYVRKGSRLHVEGALQTRKWTDEGIERYSTEIVISAYKGDLILLDKRENDATPSEEDYGAPLPEQANGSDIPFDVQLSEENPY